MQTQQKILVFQQNGSGERKIEGIRQHGGDRFRIEIVSIDQPLPDLIEDGSAYLPDRLDADLVLDYLRHPDLSADLAALCARLDVAVVASGKKGRARGVFRPPTCCGLSRNVKLGAYGKEFGSPEFRAEVHNGRVTAIDVLRGAPCGATWPAAAKVIGLAPDEAVVRIGLETQYVCSADPAGWDPIYGKSPVHFAGDVHAAALARALKG